MSSTPIRILLLADTHLGLDLPVSPRIKRRRRGDDFLANYRQVLQRALGTPPIDLVVHAGDVFNRSRPNATLAWQAFEPLVRVADAGVPVFIVPGNHERGRLPHLRFAKHPRIHVFDEPRTFEVTVRGARVALAGFAFEREGVREAFPALLERTGWRERAADVRLLVLHQAVEGATVGPADFTFTNGADVIRGRDIAEGLHAVLAGHIHRHQVLTHDLGRRALAAPVLYPGSIERTSTAEASEAKGYMLVNVTPAAQGAQGAQGARVTWEFHELPARPLVMRDLALGEESAAQLTERIRQLICAAPEDAVLTIRVRDADGSPGRLPSAATLRAMAPATMNVELRLPETRGGRGARGPRQRTRDAGPGEGTGQGDLFE